MTHYGHWITPQNERRSATQDERDRKRAEDEREHERARQLGAPLLPASHR